MSKVPGTRASMENCLLRNTHVSLRVFVTRRRALGRQCEQDKPKPCSPRCFRAGEDSDSECQMCFKVHKFCVCSHVTKRRKARVPERVPESFSPKVTLERTSSHGCFGIEKPRAGRPPPRARRAVACAGAAAHPTDRLTGVLAGAFLSPRASGLRFPLCTGRMFPG